MRIVSLVPSLTETVAKLAGVSALVGCTQFCIEPKGLHRNLSLVGGTKDFSLEKIRVLNPTHILANQEENPKELILELIKEFPLLLTFPKSPFDVPEMLLDIERFTGVSYQAFRSKLQAQLDGIGARPKLSQASFLYFIWREPYMVAGRDSYISRCLESFGFQNSYRGESRYPVLTLAEIEKLAPEKIFLSTEPYPFRKRDAERLRAEWPECPEVLQMDGRLMSWFGYATSEALAMLETVTDGGPSSLKRL